MAFLSAQPWNEIGNGFYYAYKVTSLGNGGRSSITLKTSNDLLLKKDTAGAGGGDVVSGGGGPLPRPETAFAQNAADFYGQPIPISGGRRGLQGRHIWGDGIRWYGDAGFADFAVALGAPLVPAAELSRVEVRKIWANDQLILDRSLTSGLNADPSIKFSVYPGTETQTADPLIKASLGATNAVAFRGLIYIVFRNFPLKKYGFNQIPSIRAEVVDSLSVTTQVTEFSRFGATPANDTPNGTAVDWSRGRLYMPEDAGGGQWYIDTWDVSSNSQLTRVPISITPTGVATSDEQVGYDPYFEKMFFVTGVSNTRPIYMVDPLSGETIATFGTESSNLTNDANGFVNARFFATTQVQGTDGTEYYLVVGSTLDDLGILIYDPLAGASGDRLKYTGRPGVSTTFNDVQAVTTGELVTSLTDPVAVAYACDEREVYRVTIPSGQGVDSNDAPTGDPPTWTVIHDVGAGNTITRMQFDPAFAQLIIYYTGGVGGKWVRRIEPTDAYSSANGSGSATTLFDVQMVDSNIATDTHSMQYYDLSGETGLFRVPASNEWTIVNLMNGDQETFDGSKWRFTGETSDQAGTFTPETNVYWNSAAGYALMISTSADPDFTWAKGWPGRGGSETVALSDAIRWMGLKADLEAADLDIDAAIDDQIVGAIIEDRSSIWDLYNGLAQVYDFSVSESEGKIKFVKGTKNASYTPDYQVPEVDLCPVDGSEDNPESTSFQISRLSETSMPGEMELVFIDENLDYATNTVRAQRSKFPVEIVSGDKTVTLSVPIIMSATEALSRATESLFRTWHAQLNFALRLGPKYLTMEPGDTVEVTVGSTTYYGQVLEASINADHSLSVTAERYATEGEVTIAIDDPLQDREGINSEYTELWLLDTNLVRPADHDADSLVVYAAATSGGQSGWVGGAVYMIVDGTVTQVGGRHNTDPDLAGVCQDALGAWYVSMAQDWDNSVVVSPIAGAIGGISTATHSQLVADPDLNLAAIGHPGRWEIVQVGTVVDNGDGTATLSDIIRGLRGTEAHMTDHAAGDLFITLSDRPPVARALVSTDLLDDDVVFKALPLNAVTLTGTVGSRVTVAGNSHKPFAPTELSATLSGSDIDLAWVRRTRLFDGTTLTDGDDTPPLDEATEAYEIDIYDAAGTSIVRTVTGLSSPAYTYTAAQISADGFGATPTVLKYAAYQVGAVVGRGHAATRTVDVL